LNGDVSFKSYEKDNNCKNPLLSVLSSFVKEHKMIVDFKPAKENLKKREESVEYEKEALEELMKVFS
jgi:hypothetical protein